ncbi:DUF5591 domain-containing protein [bacterium]|nr:DUF5591 domain-containing protein [bacterium]
MSALLPADAPLSVEALAQLCGLPAEGVGEAVCGLAAEGLVLRGHFVAGMPGWQYRWAAAWTRELERRTSRAVAELRAAAEVWPPLGDRDLDVTSPASEAFSQYVLERYCPPADKRLLVFLQCSVRRPFSTSPSHAFMKRAIWAATGRDPRADFLVCPVHVVVLASKVGPVPYELEDIYPANVGGGGVKHFSPGVYERTKPVLAQRMAGYLQAHGGQYDHIATFTEGRYGEVMSLASRWAGREMAVLPVAGGPRITQVGASRPRTYWQQYWIQLTLRLLEWLGADWEEPAARRLRELGALYDEG